MSAAQNLHLQAKVIVLGDKGTGKSQLVEAIRQHRCSDQLRGNIARCPLNGRTDRNEPALESAGDDQFFTVVEITAEELTAAAHGSSFPSYNSSSGVDIGVSLQFWEHSSAHPVSEQEQILAFRGALMCIIVLDITRADTANSAFNFWLSLRENLAAECFLFIVGTHLNKESRREVDLKDLCKASAKRDAIYLEVSNDVRSSSDHFAGFLVPDVSLLRRLIVQRLRYMIERKDHLVQRPLALPEQTLSLCATADDGGNPHQSAEESKCFVLDPNSSNRSATSSECLADDQHQMRSTPVQRSHCLNNREVINVPVLENNLACNYSIGSILSGTVGACGWPGGMADSGDELIRIGRSLSRFLDDLDAADERAASSDAALFEGGAADRAATRSIDDLKASASQQMEEVFADVESSPEILAASTAIGSPSSAARDAGTLITS